MNEVEIAYTAGFFDGEGCCMISPNCTVKVIVSQKNPAVLEWMMKEFGGTIHSGQRYQHAAKWALYNKKEALIFLKAIRPHLRCKATEVDYGIRLLELSATNHTRPQAKNGLFTANPNKKEREMIFKLYRAYRDQTSQQSVALRNNLKKKKDIVGDQPPALLK